MLQKYLVFKNVPNRLSFLRYTRDFVTLTPKRLHQNHHHHPPVHNDVNKYYQCVRLAWRIESQLNAQARNLTKKFNGLTLVRRNYCTQPVKKKYDRSWASLRRQHQESKKEIRRLFSLAKNEKWYLIAAIGCLFVSSSITMGVPRAIGKLMDMIVMDSFPKDKMHAFCFALFAIFAIGGLANFGRIYLMNSASKYMTIHECAREKNMFFSNFLFFRFHFSVANCERSAIAFVSHNVESGAELV